LLTSNRVGTFDEAFKSRIQVALHYAPLDKTSRKAIWQNFFTMLEEDEEEVNLAELVRHLDELSDLEMNGRQIRNSLMTARQLAMFRKESLDWEHLEQSIKTAQDFNRYLRTIHGHTDEQWAREEKLR
jgi:SpoVK/Ycf46/Vps4 family AAA+-type ATPase